MRSCFAVLSFLPILAYAQKAEIGATVGGGAFGAEDTGSPAYVVFGVEGCGFCSRSVALFGEYNHWQKPARIPDTCGSILLTSWPAAHGSSSGKASGHSLTLVLPADGTAMNI